MPVPSVAANRHAKARFQINHVTRAWKVQPLCRMIRLLYSIRASRALMNFLSRVVWSEGMYLGPQHFQAQSRYFEDSIKFAISSLWFKPYGLLGCGLDEEALRNG